MHLHVCFLELVGHDRPSRFEVGLFFQYVLLHLFVYFSLLRFLVIIEHTFVKELLEHVT